MSLRRGLIAFGMSAAVMVGGGASIREAFHEADIHAQESACLMKKYAGSKLCQKVIATPETLVNSHTANETYGIIGGVLTVGGALGIMGSILGVLETSQVELSVSEEEAQTQSQLESA